MDKFDQKILNLLSENARISVTSIGEEIGLSRTAVNERIRKLEEQGTIQRYTIELGNSQEQQKVCAYFELTFHPFNIDRVKNDLQQIPDIRQAHALSGNTDVLLFVEARSMERLTEVRTLLGQLPDLEKLVTSTALQQLI